MHRPLVPPTTTPIGSPAPASHSRRWWYSRVAPPVVFLALAVATTSALWSAPGWPENHEFGTFALRTEVYARHLARFDLAPIWSSADAAGFGTPFPLLYHKLFYLLAAILTVFVGAIGPALTTAVVLLLVTGAAGMDRVTRAVGGSMAAGTAAGVSFIAANYTVTNWLVRSALAEFCAAMLVPWVLWGFVRSLQAGRWAVPFGIALAALWLSHSVLAYFAAVLLAATAVLLATARQTPWTIFDPRTGWPAGLVFSALVAPFLVAMAAIAPEYDLTRMLPEPYLPVNQIRDLSLYFHDPHWTWGRTWQGYTTALDLPLLAGAGAAIVVLSIGRRWSITWDAFRPMLPVLGAGMLALLLQSRSAVWFYTVLPGGEFIQFPWRLLALITPALIVVATILVSRAVPGRAGAVATAALALWMVVSCGAFAPREYGRVTLQTNLEGLTFSAFREYEPISAVPLDALRTRLDAAWAAEGCVLAARDRASDEVPRIRYVATCARAALLPLPLYASPFHTVRHGGDERTMGCVSVRDFPALCGVAFTPGRHDVQVNMPHLGEVVRWALRGGAALPGRVPGVTGTGGALR